MGLRIDHHIYIHQESDSETNKLLRQILGLNNQIIQDMAKTKAEFSQALAEIGTSLDNISADIIRLTDQLQNGGLTDAEEEEVFAELRAVADRAKSIADTTPEPPTEEPIP